MGPGMFRGPFLGGISLNEKKIELLAPAGDMERLEMALAYGVKVTGATVHFVNEECDGGPILLQKAEDILPGDTPEVLQKRVMEQAEWKLLPKAVAMVCSGEIE